MTRIWSSWLRRQWAASSNRKQLSRARRFRPALEGLEERAVPTTYIVTGFTDDLAAPPINPADDPANVNSLRHAIDAANANAGADIILLPPGTYTLDIQGANDNGNFTGDLDITGNVTIDRQGSSGTVIVNASALNDRVFHINGAATTVVLKNMTITGGGNTDVGGGVVNEGNLTIQNCVVMGNAATGTLNFTSTALANTGGDGQGGGVASFGSNLSIIDSTIDGNSATGGVGDSGAAVGDGVGGKGIGGGVFVFGGSVSITQSTISNNTAKGGVGTTGNASFAAIGGDGVGGGLATLTSKVTIVNSTFSGNAATGGDANSATSPRTAGDAQGGAASFDIAAADSNVTNNTFAFNSATAGAGTTAGAATGGGIFENASAAAIGFASTIVAKNTAAGGNPDVVGTFFSDGFNLIGNGSGSSGFTHNLNNDQVGTSGSPIDPLLVALQDNGGPTKTHAIGGSSPALNKGTNPGNDLSTDQRGVGFPRSIGQTDVGAFENQTVTPLVSSIIRQTPPGALTNAASVIFLVTFDSSVSGVTTSNFTAVAGGGLTGPSVTNVSPSSGSATTFTVTVNTGSGDGTVGLNMTNSTGVTNGGGQAVANLPFVGQTYTIDKTAPLVASINRVTASPTNAASVQFTVTFGEDVGALASGNFTVVVTGGVSGHSITSVTGSNKVWTVTVNTGSGDGSIGLNMTSSAGTSDAAGNAVGNLTFVGQVYTIDKTGPQVTAINRVNSSPTNAASVQFTLTLNEALTSAPAAGNFTVVMGGGVSGASITGISGSGSSFTITVGTGSGDGTLGLNMTSSAGRSDAAGNGISNLPFTGQVYAIDKTAPLVSSINRGSTNPTNSSTTVDFNVVFNEDIGALASGNFTLVQGGGVSGASIQSVTGSAKNWTVVVATGSGNGTLGLNMTSNTGSGDAAGNLVGNLPFVGQVYNVDKTVPTALATLSNVTATGGTTYDFTVTFTDNVAIAFASLSGSNIRVTGPNSFSQMAAFLGASSNANVSPNTATYRVTAPGGTWDVGDNGTYTVTLLANQVRDTAGNAVFAVDTSLGTFDASIAAGPVTDVSAQMVVIRGGFRRNRATSSYIQTIYLTNKGTGALGSTIQFVVENLPSGITVNAPANHTVSNPAPGKFVISVNKAFLGSLAPNQTHKFDLSFGNPTNKAITYTYKVQQDTSL